MCGSGATIGTTATTREQCRIRLDLPAAPIVSYGAAAGTMVRPFCFAPIATQAIRRTQTSTSASVSAGHSLDPMHVLLQELRRSLALLQNDIGTPLVQIQIPTRSTEHNSRIPGCWKLHRAATSSANSIRLSIYPAFVSPFGAKFAVFV